MHKIYIYEWGAWDHYLFPMLFKSAFRIKADIVQKNDAILDQISESNGYFLFHINLSETTQFFEDKEMLCSDLKLRNIRYLNKGVSNISKSFVQDMCLHLKLNSTRALQNGDPNELLIIKSNNNFGGLNENKLTEPQRIKLGIINTSLDRKFEYIITKRYEVEPSIWQDKSCVIEKYISNLDNLFYRVYKLNSRFVISEVINLDQIKKMYSGIKRTNYYFDTSDKNLFGTIREEIKELSLIIDKFCTCFRLDFGALDIVKNDKNQFYIIDVNNTPYWGTELQPDLFQFLIDAL